MKSDALRGHLDALILAVLEKEPLHGYAVMQAIQVSSGGALELPTGSLYPALRRLERAGYVQGEWRMVGGRRRRTYELTKAGERALAAERAEWRDFAAVVEGVLRPGTTPA
ncbi:PadR family transcriptional regulator [Streptomyces jumonjinensis]|uniref:PadR family transcriptional regulator n=1 Tax=Streptomyces jumonjinensis TaxID=1945 RepID=A0A646KDQ3_STRJU|nr:PadR family transcriptional regulator [Streptomyces jumonjinensis]MQT00409.1 PadR family transcriptional regulator [Streptomyces jumonjinensis]